MDNDWDRFGHELSSWAEDTFGKNRTLKSILDHLKEELDEISLTPSDGLEWADALHLLLDGARISGFSPSDLLHMAKVKLEVNRGRKWTTDDLGVNRHYE